MPAHVPQERGRKEQGYFPGHANADRRQMIGEGLRDDCTDRGTKEVRTDVA